MASGNTPPNISTTNPMVDKFYDNTQSNIIRITDDKLKVILLENKEAVQKQGNFWTPLVLLVTLILAFCTTDFKDFLSIPKEYWGGFYMFCTLGALIWLIIEWKKIKKAMSIEELTERIRNQRTSEE